MAPINKTLGISKEKIKAIMIANDNEQLNNIQKRSIIIGKEPKIRFGSHIYVQCAPRSFLDLSLDAATLKSKIRLLCDQQIQKAKKEKRNEKAKEETKEEAKEEAKEESSSLNVQD